MYMIIYYFYFLWSIDCWSPLSSSRLRILYLLSQYHDFLLYLSLCVTRPSSIFYHKNISGVRKLSSLWHVQYCQAYIKFMSRQNWLKKDINDKTLKDSLIVPDFLLFLFLWGLTFLLWYFSYYEAIIRVVVSFYLKWVQVLGFNFFKHTLFQSFFSIFDVSVLHLRSELWDKHQWKFLWKSLLSLDKRGRLEYAFS